MVVRGSSLVRTTCDPTAHAETVALREAGTALRRANFSGCTLYTTFEPCPMCCGALLEGGITTLVMGARPAPGAGRWGDYTVERLIDLAKRGRAIEVVTGILTQESADIRQGEGASPDALFNRWRWSMDESIKHALERDRTIDITTTGRKTGQPRRTEIWFHNVEGRLYITGTPGRRDWYANMLAHPEFTFHLKQSIRADLPARATAVLDKAQRREIMATIHQKLSGKRDLEAWVEGSPLVVVELLIE